MIIYDIRTPSKAFSNRSLMSGLNESLILERVRHATFVSFWVLSFKKALIKKKKSNVR